MDHRSPWVEIVKQPTGRLRFDRGKGAVHVHGFHESSYRKKTTSPQIKVHGTSDHFVVVVSCVSVNEPYKPHPNILIGPECKKGVRTIRVHKSNTIAFPNVIINKARREDINIRLKERKDINVDPYQTGFKYKESDIDLHVVRLCFQVFLPDNHGKITRVVPPVVSHPIYDEKHRDRTDVSFLKKHLYQQVEEQSELCDVIVQVGTWTRQYHWNVLCIIPFFARLYASKLKERQTGIISLSIGNAYSVQSALDFLYGIRPNVELHTAYNLLETADFLMIDELKNICMKKVKSFTVSSQSCLTLLFISSRFDIFIPNLEDFYLSHLPELMKQDQMLEIDKEAVRLFLTDQTLSYIDKDDIIWFLVKWAAYSPDRKSGFRDMLFYLERIDFTNEILRVVHDIYPDLENTIEEVHPGCHFMNSNNQIMKINNRCDVIVLYPPDKKLATLIFYGYSLKHKCWFKIPIKSNDFEDSSQVVAHGTDKIYTLDMRSETVSVFNLASGQSNIKKLKFQEDAYVLAFDVPLAVSEETIYIAKNFHNIVLNTNAGNVSFYEGPPDLIKVETSTMVYASANLESTEIIMERLFSIDSQVDMMCTSGNLLCLLSQTSHLLIVYCLKRQIRTTINLPSGSLIHRDGMMTSSGSHVFILMGSFIVDIEFETSPKKILWKIHNIYLNELFSSSVVSVCQITQGKIVMQTEDDMTQEPMLKWQEIRSTKSDETTEKVYNMGVPKKLLCFNEHRLMQLQLPKEALKCHIDCPHCKYKETEQLDLFSYQLSFSSAEESADEQPSNWSDEDPDTWSATDDSEEEF